MDTNLLGTRKFKDTAKAGMMAGYFSSFIHGKVFDVIERIYPNKNGNILDVGAGHGAFTERLLDSGYSNVTAIEKYTKFEPQVKCYKFDLNSPWVLEEKEGQIDVIVAIEIIEHVHSPYFFLKQARKIIKDDGILIVSTPNPLVFESRIHMLIGNGVEMIRKHPDHRTPIFPDMFEKICREIGFNIIERHFDVDTLLVPSTTFKGFIKKAVARILRKILSNDIYNRGNSNIWVLSTGQSEAYYPGK